MELIKNKEIIANHGYRLTNGTVIGDRVLLSCLDNAENWWEISNEEAEEL